MLVEELVAKKRQLESEIQELEERVSPLQAALNQKRESLALLSRFIELETGNIATELPRSVVSAPTPRKIVWADVAREQRMRVGGDSAHRVVARLDPSLHSSLHAAQGTICDLQPTA